MFIVISIHALRVEGDAYPGTKCVNKLYFYPRPPGGGRHKYLTSATKTTSISIHALRVEGDGSVMYMSSASSLFLSTPSGWRATYLPCLITSFKLFLSTPSGWRATVSFADRLGKIDISIHALRVEGDVGVPPVHARGVISIHALRVEGDSKNGQNFRLFLRKREKNLPL